MCVLGIETQPPLQPPRRGLLHERSTCTCTPNKAVWCQPPLHQILHQFPPQSNIKLLHTCLQAAPDGNGQEFQLPADSDGVAAETTSEVQGRWREEAADEHQQHYCKEDGAPCSDDHQ